MTPETTKFASVLWAVAALSAFFGMMLLLLVGY